MNAAVWFGTAVFFLIGVQPVMGSADVQNLLGPKNFPYFGTAIGQMFAARYFHLHLACGIIALLHLVAELVYLGRWLSRFWGGLLAGLFLFALCESIWLQPRLEELHRVRYAVTTATAQRDVANRSFARWQLASQILNLLATAGIGLYLWRVANPPDPTRFVSATKFRS